MHGNLIYVLFLYDILLYHCFQVDQVLVIGDNCLYPKNNTSWVIGLFAASSLLVSQFISNICGGCICCSFNKNKTAHTHHSTPTRRVAILCLVLSWYNDFTLILISLAYNRYDSCSYSICHVQMVKW